MDFIKLREFLKKVCGGIEEQFQLKSTDYFIAGGLFATLLNGIEADPWIKDIDVFFLTKDAARFIENTSGDFAPKSNENAAWAYLPTPNNTHQLINFVYSKYGTPDEVVSRFDFEHTQSYYVPSTGELFIHPTTVTNKLIPANLNNSNGFQRMMYFIKRGYEISREDFIRILNQTNLNVIDQKAFTYKSGY